MNFNKNINLLLVLLLLVSGFTFAQQAISGLVTDEAGVPLPGATVVVDQTNDGTTTDFDGNYSISASDGQSISISFVGYETLSIVVGDGADYNVSLQPDSLLDEVVVTALGIERNTKALGYSVTQVGGEEINEIKSTNAINALQGKIAGVQISGNAAGAKGSTRVIIRGNSSLSGNNMPLYVVDGIPIDNTNLGSAGVWGGADAGDGISALNPDEIESVSVLKGGAAAALYGSRASNGVILITTKKGTGVEGIQVEVTSSVQFDDIKNDPYDPQTTYGQGRDYSTNSDTVDTYANWGIPLNGSSVEQWDGVSRPYSYKGNNLEKFYSGGETYINTVAVSSSSQTGNVRMSYSNLQNKDIIPNSTLDRNTFGINANQKIGKELNRVFDFFEVNYKIKEYKHLIVSPHYTRTAIYDLIETEIFNTMQGKKSGIKLKLNSLSDSRLIDRLYAASRAGVKIQLIVRGICCLIPGVKAMSENIEVISVVDKFLEHPRLYIFENDGAPKIYISSADFMRRNLDTRVEISCPIYDQQIKEEILETFDICWSDNVKARCISQKQDNLYRKNNNPKVRSQFALYAYYKNKLEN